MLEDKTISEFVFKISKSWGISTDTVMILIAIIAIWSLVWTLLGLWKSARRGSWIWFIILALTNTLGLLPILYIYIFADSRCCHLVLKKKFFKETKKRIQKKSVKRVKKKKR
jgi:hypothetical protein